METRQYGRWFCSACDIGDNPLAKLKAFFNDKGWPSDTDFMPQFQHMPLYQGSYCRAVLEGIESSSQAASEPVVLTGCSIEHVMPQTIRDDPDGRAWMAALGDRWSEIHAKWLHTPGNLTLVGSDYNSKMKNSSFQDKKPLLAGISRVYLNMYFSDHPNLNEWNETTIVERGLHLAQLATQVWMGPA